MNNDYKLTKKGLIDYQGHKLAYIRDNYYLDFEKEMEFSEEDVENILHLFKKFKEKNKDTHT